MSLAEDYLLVSTNVQSQLREVQARVSTLEAQVSLARQTETQERTAEITKVQKAAENELKQKHEVSTTYND